MRTDILEMLDSYEANREASMFPEPETGALDFGLPLTEKHRPQRVLDFIGIQDAKAIFANLIKRPRPCALLLLGAPGLGKTTLSLAFAKELNAGLIKVDSGQLTVDRVADIRDKIQYFPPTGEFWVVLCDEADRMSPAAQVALLSALDSANVLKPKLGGCFEQGAPLTVIWVFTANGKGETQTEAPDGLTARFIQRCLTVKFPPVNGEMAGWISGIWEKETGSAVPEGWAQSEATEASGSPREALQRLDLELLKTR